MKPTIGFLKEKFRQFNHQYFADKLPPINLQINHSKSRIGLFRSKRYYKPRGLFEDRDFLIAITDRYDLPIEVLEDTLIHEMIHYYIRYFNYQDTSAHGELFCRYMNKINEVSGRHISVSVEVPEGSLTPDNSFRTHYFCVTYWDDIDGPCVTVAASTAIFRLNNAFLSSPHLKSIEWYMTLDPYFNKYPTVRTPKYYPVGDPNFSDLLRYAFPCAITGRTLKVLDNPNI